MAVRAKLNNDDPPFNPYDDDFPYDVTINPGNPYVSNKIARVLEMAQTICPEILVYIETPPGGQPKPAGVLSRIWQALSEVWDA